MTAWPGGRVGPVHAPTPYLRRRVPLWTDPRLAAALPLPLVAPTYAAAGFLATLGGNDPQETIAALASAPVCSVEVTYRLVRAHLDAGDTQRRRPPWPRNRWPRWPGSPATGDPTGTTGLIALTSGDLDEAEAAFDAVYAMVPGEPAAQLALAATDEAARRHRRRPASGTCGCGGSTTATSAPRSGWPGSSSMGGDRAEAVSILDEVPEVSSQYLAAQIAAVRASLDTTPGTLTEQDLVASSTRLERLRLDAGPPRRPRGRDAARVRWTGWPHGHRRP